MRHVLVCAAALALALSACGPEGETPSDDTGTDGGDVAVDDVPPEFRNIQIAIQGEYSSKVDLSAGDATRILPVSANAEIKVLAGDDQTQRKDLEVAAVTPDGSKISTRDRAFRNGLWTFTVELAPGDVVRVRATDRTGNAVTSEHKLTISTRAEALVAEWEKRLFTNDEEPEIRETYGRTMKGDGSWSEDRNDYELGGTYRVEDGTLVVQKTYQTGGDSSDSDKSTVERDRAASFFADRQFFSDRPWNRDGSGSGIAGTWTRKAKWYDHGGGDRTLAKRVRETLELTEKSGESNRWTYTRKVTDTDSGDASTETASGTWETIELTSIYGDNFGTFLRRTTEKRNGQDLQSTETRTQLYRMPLDVLLISPYVRSSPLDE